MNILGGGGHAGAGSASIKSREVSPEEIKDKILAVLRANKTESATIADIMSFPVISVLPQTKMREVQSLMAEENIRGVMVMEDDEIQGMIVLWDFKKIKKDSQWKSPVKAFMARTLSPSIRAPHRSRPPEPCSKMMWGIFP